MIRSADDLSYQKDVTNLFHLFILNPSTFSFLQLDLILPLSPSLCQLRSDIAVKSLQWKVLQLLLLKFTLFTNQR